MATNQFLSFGQGTGANVLSQTDWAALAARTGGFQAGTASSAAANKAWRQALLASAALGQFIADFSGADALDTDTPAQMEAKFILAMRSQILGSEAIFNTQGSFTATVPSWATSADVIVTGAGGGSGGSPGGQASGGGGAGGTAIKRITGLVPGSSIAVTVGAPGTAGNTSGSGSAANGGAGGTSSFGAYCSATGGSGGLYFAAGPAGGAPGAGTGGDLNLSGGYGSDGLANGATFGGIGGASYWGGGSRAVQGSSGGLAGLAPGSGAGGVYGSTAQSGAFGAAGIVHITWRP